MKKKLVAFLMCILLLISSFCLPSYAEDADFFVDLMDLIDFLNEEAANYTLDATEIEAAESAAEELQELGVLRGIGTNADGSTDFGITNRMNRCEAITMVVRLLGGEEESKAYSNHPFQDVPEWARSYISYAYAKGLVKGISATEFGSANYITCEQFERLLLRVLGYDDSNIEFINSVAENIGLITPRIVGSNTPFYRGNAILMIKSALNAICVDKGITLLANLEFSGAVQNARPTELCGYKFCSSISIVKDVYLDDPSQTIPALYNAIISHTPYLTFHVPKGQIDSYKKEIDDVDYAYFFDGYSFNSKPYEAYGDKFSIEFSNEIYLLIAYLQGKTNNINYKQRRMIEEIEKFGNTYLTPERVVAIREYLNDYYENGNLEQDPFDIIEKHDVRHSFAKVFNLFCYCFGVESQPAFGTLKIAPGGTACSNVVCISGNWYHLLHFDNDLFLVGDEKFNKILEIYPNQFIPERPADYGFAASH